MLADELCKLGGRVLANAQSRLGHEKIGLRLNRGLLHTHSLRISKATLRLMALRAQIC